MRTLRPILLLTACLLLAGCHSISNYETVSLLGRPLQRPPIDAAKRPQLEANLAAAQAAFDRDPYSETNIIWLGRRLAYLGRFHDAVDVYTHGLKKHPESYRLLRHRGHRSITLRQFDDAIRDLERAAILAESVTDQVEPDGDPNPANQPRSTDKSNIFYHLGLAYYLKGEWARSVEAFARRNDLAAFNDDMLVSMTHWQYLSLRRLGRDADAQHLLDPIRPGMDVAENDGYYKLVRMYKGQLTPDEILVRNAAASPQNASIAYGVAAWRLVTGDAAAARAGFTELVEQGNWTSFGVIAAEAELAREAR